MTALHEKYLWPLVGIVIFAVLATFYIVDYRKLKNENGTDNPNKQATAETQVIEQQNSTNSNDNSAVQKNPQGTSAVVNLEFTGSIEEYLHKYGDEAKATSKIINQQAAENQSAPTSGKGNSRSLQEYLSESSRAHHEALIQAANKHAAFSGNIDEYLAYQADEPTDVENKDSISTSEETVEIEPTKVETHKQNTATSYSGSIEEYLNKFSDPQVGANKPGHAGFHGSYEDYQKKYH